MYKSGVVSGEADGIQRLLFTTSKVDAVVPSASVESGHLGVTKDG